MKNSRKTVAQFDPTGGRKPGGSSAIKKPTSGTGYTRTATSRSTGKKTTTSGVSKPLTKTEYTTTGGMSKIKKPYRSTGGNKF